MFLFDLKNITFPNGLLKGLVKKDYFTKVYLFQMCLIKVRVPTHLDGRSLYWEFATDGYDIGFGLFFEWVDPEDTQVAVVLLTLQTGLFVEKDRRNTSSVMAMSQYNGG